MSGSMNLLLNCSLQRFINNNFYIQHIFLFISIFLFTYILKWFTPPIFTNTDDTIHPLDSTNDKYDYIKSSLKNTLLVYIIFLLSTKQVDSTLFIFFALMIVSFILYISYLVEIETFQLGFDGIQQLFVSKEQLNQLTNNGKIDMLYYLHNSLSISYISLFVNLAVGTFCYYKKQRIDHASNWSILKFTFGTNKCKGI